MPYDPTTWVQGVTPLGPVNMNKLEQGVKAAHDAIDAHLIDTAEAHTAAAISYAGSTNLSAATVEGALDELDNEKAGLAQANTFTSGQTVDQVAPSAGQVQPYWVLQQGGADKFRFTLDSSGNLVIQNYTEGAWATTATVPLAGGVVTGLNAEKVGGETLAQIKANAIAMAIALGG